ncbi:MAG: transporter substrate-binding protein [Gemmataceae bacterium]
MAQNPGCPQLHDLEMLVDGSTNATEASQLTQHVRTCPQCLQTVYGMKDGNTLIEKLRSVAPIDPTVEGQMNTLVQEGKPRAPLIASGGGGDFRTDILLKRLLDLPQGEGELGRLKHYRVISILGAGGMGVVFKAEDTSLERTVAIKVLQTDLLEDDQARQRFVREARGMAAIRNDNVANVFEVGEQNGVPYFVMEFLEGETLEDSLLKSRKLELNEVLRIGREVAEGLAAAHEQGFIHRDIKPANVWLDRRTGHAKILDFGLARQLGSGSAKGLTSTGTIMGTPNYMAPEQARGDAVDTRCDLFSLGCMLYHMCSGVLPFDGPSTMAILTALAVDQPEALERLDPKLPVDLIELVNQLLEKKRENRPASARVVAEALRAMESGAASPIRRRRNSSLSPVYVLAALGGLLAAGVLFFFLRGGSGGDQTAVPTGPPIRIGLLYSQTGTMRDSEVVVAHGVRLAVEEINARGGVLGRPIEIVPADGESDENVFAQRARDLINNDKVVTIFGCWTSASRKAVKPVVEASDHLLVYPVQYEGLEQSPNIIYTGATPNQQILPAIAYCTGNLHKERFFLVGSDYVFPRVANKLIRDELGKNKGVEVVGEEYLPLGSPEVDEIVKKIAASKADVIVNTINGDTNRPFFRALRHHGITAEKVPTISFSIAEQELRSLDIKDMMGDLAAWNYFQSIESPANDAFVKKVKERFDPETVTSDPMEAAYFGVHLWAQGVEKAGKTDPLAIRDAMKGEAFDAPEGKVRIDPETQHTYKIFRLGEIGPKGQFKIRLTSGSAEEPMPFPPGQSRAEWEALLLKLYKGWGGRWSNPEK